METTRKEILIPDEEVIFLSSDSENEGDSLNLNNLGTCTPRQAQASVTSDIKRESDTETANAKATKHGKTTPSTEQPTGQNITSRFTFDPFALFGPENASMPIEDRLGSFISNVQSLTEENAKLEKAERHAKRQYEEATQQLTTANQEITKLKENLNESQSKINQQTGSLSELKAVVDKLKKQETGSKSKVTNITSTLMNLQAKMVQILEETEIDGSSSAVVLSTPSATEKATNLSRQSALTMDQGNGMLSEAILKENIDNFEKDFETKFAQIEEQDREIKNEIHRTNEMLHKLQASIMERLQPESLAASPQLTYESMEDQDLNDEQETAPGFSGSRSRSGKHSGGAKKKSTI